MGGLPFLTIHLPTQTWEPPPSTVQNAAVNTGVPSLIFAGKETKSEQRDEMTGWFQWPQAAGLRLCSKMPETLSFPSIQQTCAFGLLLSPGPLKDAGDGEISKTDSVLALFTFQGGKR